MIWSLDAIAQYIDEHGRDDATTIFGGKATSLAVMVAEGLDVPPALVIPITQDYDAAHRSQLRLRLLGDEFGGFGTEEQGFHPALLSVRSGAAVSMPGMMDTVLNVGVMEQHLDYPFIDFSVPEEPETPEQVRYKAFQQVVQEFFGVTSWGEIDDKIKALVVEKGVPASGQIDPWDALDSAINAVQLSWDSEKCLQYREMMGLEYLPGTAVIVQKMVFGDMDIHSGTGVAFSRNPDTGSPVPTVDFAIKAQGEAVVAGEINVVNLEKMRELFPEKLEELRAGMFDLERSYRDMVDVEFTIQDGKLWWLQARVGKRSPNAVAPILIDQIFDSTFDLSLEEALGRIEGLDLTATTAYDIPQTKPSHTGVGIGNGVVEGFLVLKPEDIKPDRTNIWYAPNTSPEDVPAMLECDGIITLNGGAVSHAALICRENNIPGVVGIGMSPGFFPVELDKMYTLCAQTGEVWSPSVPTQVHQFD